MDNYGESEQNAYKTREASAIMTEEMGEGLLWPEMADAFGRGGW